MVSNCMQGMGKKIADIELVRTEYRVVAVGHGVNMEKYWSKYNG